MIKEIGNKEYEFNVKLGVTIEIKKKLNKSFNQVLNEMDKMDVADLIKLLYCGVNKEIPYSDFEQDVLDNIGLMELYELVQSFIKKIQYPGLTEEEIDKKLEEKNLEYQAKKETLLKK